MAVALHDGMAARTGVRRGGGATLQVWGRATRPADRVTVREASVSSPGGSLQLCDGSRGRVAAPCPSRGHWRILLGEVGQVQFRSSTEPVLPKTAGGGSGREGRSRDCEKGDTAEEGGWAVGYGGNGSSWRAGLVPGRGSDE